MKVYPARRVYAFEGADVIEIFDNKEAAIKYAELKNKESGFSVIIEKSGYWSSAVCGQDYYDYVEYDLLSEYNPED